MLGDGLKAFHGAGRQLELTDGQRLETDMTILSIGVLPENRLAKAAEIELGFKGAIKVNRQMETRQADIMRLAMS